MSKTLFIKGLQCHKQLYLSKNSPELKDKITESQEAIFSAGHDVGRYALQLFPGGVEIPYEGLSISEQLAQTREEMAKGTTDIYEAAFIHKDVFCKVDILHKGTDGWEIYEVKASTGLKEVYLNDISVQHYILTGAGLDVSKAHLVRINNEYVRQGNINAHEYFSIMDITEAVQGKQAFITEEIKKMQNMLLGDLPAIDIGPHCSKPYSCDFEGHCRQHIPENSIFSIRDRFDARFDLYRQGIIRMEDVPLEALSSRQKIQVNGTLHKKNIVDRDAVQAFLDTLWYPMAFLDFETTMLVPLPRFDGIRPYQSYPFQYSLHLLQSPSSQLQHFEYLAPTGSDPRRELTEKIVSLIPENACTLVWNQSFEKGVIADLQEWFPEHAASLKNITNNIRDLMIPFSKTNLYLWQFNGSYSLKNVLPALVPQMGYANMDIGDGGAASNAWLGTWKMTDPVKIEKTRKALLEYCGLDTLAMVKILEEMRDIIEVKQLESK